MASVDQSAWDGAEAMSRAAAADDPAVAYEAICAGRKEGDPAVQSSWALPHHYPGDPPNAAGVRNALARFSQTEGLTNSEAARSHLESHMSDISPEEREDNPEIVLQTREMETEGLEVREESKRELVTRLLTYGDVVDTDFGPETFERGAFKDVNPKDVVMFLGHDKHPAGVGVQLEEREDAPYMVLRASKTPLGDEILALASDGATKGTSVGFYEVPGGTYLETRGGRRTRVHRRVRLEHVGITYKPRYKGGAVLQVREDQEGAPAMAETTAQPTTDASVEIVNIVKGLQERQEASEARVLEAVERVEERYRSSFSVPASEKPKAKLFDWSSWALRVLNGQNVSTNEIQERELADVVTPDNPGLVPPAFLTELIGEIDTSRPFLSSTRQLVAPDTGMSITLPVIEQRPSADVQEYEKTEIASTALKVGTQTFDAVTIAGGADVSLQMVKRATRTFFDLLNQTLAEAYAAQAEAQGINALLSAYGGPTSGTSPLDPENLLLGEAWSNSIQAARVAPDTIWLDSAAVAAFIDAKANGSNMPLYSDLAANMNAGTGAAGVVSGLRPIYVPGLDGSGVDVIVGPSRKYAWAEDGAFNLQVDVPSKAGRDIALVGFMFFAPLVPAAFTTYTLGS